VKLTVLPGNNPYGLYQYNDSSLGVTIGRDSATTKASLSVMKTSGASDYFPVSDMCSSQYVVSRSSTVALVITLYVFKVIKWSF